MSYVYLAIGFAVLVILVVVLWVSLGRAVRQVARELERELRGCQMQKADLQVALGVAQESARRQEVRANGFFEVIEGIERERNDWQRKYFREAICHGNAQQLMMRTIEELASKLVGLGHQVQIDAAVREASEAHWAQHGEPVRRQVASLQQNTVAKNVAEGVPEKTEVSSA